MRAELCSPAPSGSGKKLELCESRDAAELQEQTQGRGSDYKHVSAYFTCIKKETFGFKSMKIVEARHSPEQTAKQ